MTNGPSLHDRSRLLTEEELQGVPWLPLLSEVERERVTPELRTTQAQPGELVCRIGRLPSYWVGVIEGLLKMSSETASGKTVSYSGLSPGGWFAEGTVIKREPFRYNVQALRKSLIAGLPVDTFHWLLDHSIGFNRFIMSQLNERLGQFIAVLGVGRSSSPEQRVARQLAAIVNPVLFPGVGEVLHITQQELAHLAGLSRQRVNQALRALQERAILRVEYGGLRILQRDALNREDL